MVPVEVPQGERGGKDAGERPGANATTGRIASTCRSAWLEISFGPLETLTSAVCGALVFDAGISAVSVMELTYDVATGFPFQRITDAGTKPAPLTVRVNAEPPGVTAEGTRGWSM